MKTSNRLTSLQLPALLKQPGRHRDGDGLILLVRDNGAAFWIMRYMLGGKARELGLGPLRMVNLAEARARAREARQALLDRVDPVQAKHAAMQARKIEALRTTTFAQAAEQFLAVNSSEWKNDVHRKQWRSTLTTYAFPVFGSLPVQSIDTALIMKALAPIWQTKRETAERVRGRINRVLTWATAQQLRSGDNPADWEILKHLLPNGKKAKQHHPALPYAELPGFMADLRAKDSTSARALEFTILTGARTSEVIGAQWSEVDLELQIWTCPAARTKSGRPHRVPLTERAIQILRARLIASESQAKSLGPFPLSNMAMLALLKGVRPDLTVHGFRSTFSDWARDRTAYSRDVIEMALAHQIRDKSEAAYRRGDALDKRRRLMAEWSRYCEAPAGDAKNVVSMRA